MKDKNSDSTIDLIHLRVGTQEKPAGEADVQKVRDDLQKVLKDNGIDAAVFATKHDAEVRIVPGMKMCNGRMIKEGE